jgi:nucleoside-diphosphate-sugar epimerase
VADALRAAPGDVVVLGAGGKMGPSLSRMLRRAADALGDGRNVFAVSRWTDDAPRLALERDGVRVVRADLMNAATLAGLPDAPNVVYMAGQKFGTADAPHRTWMANVVLPALAAERYAASRIVAFSTGNVYPLVAATGRSSREGDALAPVGEYAMSCVGRERVFEHAAQTRGTRVAIVRLNYAVDLRYGVLVDVAERVRDGRPVNVAMGYANVIWQGDANAQAIRCLPLASAPPFILNVTGPDRVRIRDAAARLGEHFGKPVRVEDTEAPDALLSDTTRARDLFGEPTVSTTTLLEWVGDWVGRGGSRLGKPTHFEERGGRF